ncbi:MAG: hypothetical protein WBZ23_13035, partial [Pseudolabrys sp.]
NSRKEEKEESGVLHLIASCSTDIAVLGTQELSTKLDNDNRITRIFRRFLKWQLATFAAHFDHRTTRKPNDSSS